MNYYIEAIGYYLPEKIIDNAFLSEKCGIDPGFLISKIGIRTRHIASDDEPTSELAYRATINLFSKLDLDISEIGLLLVCTQNPDYKLPTTACILQNRLGISKNSICFDINLGCSGFPYSLVIAGNFLKLGLAKKALLIMADEYSRNVDYYDRNTASIFGDAGSAILLNCCNEQYGIVDAVFGTDGSGSHHLIVPNSGSSSDVTKSNKLFMNGREIYKFSITVIPESINEILGRNNLSIQHIRYFIFHQANKFMLEEIRLRLNISPEQMVVDMEDYGNTVSSTIPIAFSNLIDKALIKRGDMIIFSGFGVGLSWSTVLYKSL